MKFLIDDVEIKTVIKNATIGGSLNLISRFSSFSYIFNQNDSNFINYKAKTGSSIVIKNDDNENIFKGFVTSVNYSPETGLVQIQGQDYFSKLIEKTVKGRFKGTFTSIVSRLTDGFDITFGLSSILENEINIVNLGGLTYYDILTVAAEKLYGTADFKFFLDGNCSLKILFPLLSESKGDFVIGQNIISADFTSDKSANSAKIKALGNDDIVSGTIIRVADNTNDVKGYFTVVKDSHIYSNIHTMELELKERKFNL